MNQPNTNMQRAPGDKVRDLADLLKGKEAAMSRLAGDVLDAPRLTSLALAATRKTPALLNCSAESILQSCMDAARLGLEPDGVQGAIIPYGRDAQFVPMYRGLIALAYREPVLQTIDVETVYDCDAFEVQRGTSAFILHKPAWDREAGAKAIAWYCVTKTRGEVAFDIMFPKDIEAIRARGPQRKGPWDTDFNEMAKKTVLKRRLKKVPASARLRDAVAHDETVEMTAVSVDETKQTKSRSEKLAAALTDGKQAKQKPADDPPPGDDEGPSEPPGFSDGPTDEPAAPKSDDEVMLAMMRAVPKPQANADEKARKKPLIDHAVKAKSVSDAAYKTCVLLAKHRLGDTGALMSGEPEALAAALAKVNAAGGFVDV